MNKWFVLVFILFLFSCVKISKTNQEYKNITQGIRGQIEVREGNFMPGPERFNQPGISPKGRAANREIFIYEPTKRNQLKASGVFHTDIQTILVAKVVADKEGVFQVTLKPGKYSLFSKEPDGSFANRQDGEGFLFLVEVKAGQVSEVDFIIDYNASY